MGDSMLELLMSLCCSDIMVICEVVPLACLPIRWHDIVWFHDVTVQRVSEFFFN